MKEVTSFSADLGRILYRFYVVAMFYTLWHSPFGLPLMIVVFYFLLEESFASLRGEGLVFFIVHYVRQSLPGLALVVAVCRCIYQLSQKISQEWVFIFAAGIFATFFVLLIGSKIGKKIWV